MDTFCITFFGVGGSSSVGSPNRQEYGSNTVSALVEAGNQSIVLDMGSGLIPLCAALTSPSDGFADNDNGEKPPIHILLGHFHYDHIEGFPFLKLPHGSRVHIWAEGREGKSPKEILYGFMQQPYFPVTPSIYEGLVEYHEIQNGQSFLLSDTLSVETIRLNHPGMVTGYKLIYNEKSLVYLLDYEHDADPASAKALRNFCQNADLLIYDAFYTEEEYSTGRFKGWGHSTHEEGVRLANGAGVKKLVLSHHANWRSDKELDTIGKAIAKASMGECIMAREGLVLPI